MADRSVRIAGWRVLRVGSPDDTLHSATKQPPLRFSRDTYHPWASPRSPRRKCIESLSAAALQVPRAHRKVPASNDRELRRRHSKAKKWEVYESFQAAFEQWSHLQGSFR